MFSLHSVTVGCSFGSVSMTERLQLLSSCGLVGVAVVVNVIVSSATIEWTALVLSVAVAIANIRVWAWRKTRHSTWRSTHNDCDDDNDDNDADDDSSNWQSDRSMTESSCTRRIWSSAAARHHCVSTHIHCEYIALIITTCMWTHVQNSEWSV